MACMSVYGDVQLKDIPVGGYAESRPDWYNFKLAWWVHAPIVRTELVFMGEKIIFENRDEANWGYP